MPRVLSLPCNDARVQIGQRRLERKADLWKAATLAATEAEGACRQKTTIKRDPFDVG